MGPDACWYSGPALLCKSKSFIASLLDAAVSYGLWIWGPQVVFSWLLFVRCSSSACGSASSLRGGECSRALEPLSCYVRERGAWCASVWINAGESVRIREWWLKCEPVRFICIPLWASCGKGLRAYEDFYCVWPTLHTTIFQRFSLQWYSSIFSVPADFIFRFVIQLKIASC